MMRENILITLCLIGTIITSKAQNSNKNLPLINIPSPNAMALGSYGEFPVSLSSGTPEISIPLYEIKTKGLRLPISVSYHASGIKVNEMATSVGLGFVLNAGGAITRRINDLPDFDAKGFNNIVVPEEYDPSEKVNYFLGNITRSLKYSNTPFSKTDAQPDNYFYNYAGSAGEFILKNKKAVGMASEFTTIPYSPKRIIYNNDDQFKLVDESGAQYIFGKSIINSEKAIESGSSTNYFIPIQYSTSAWYLTEMISSDMTDTIAFKYAPSVNLSFFYQSNSLTSKYYMFPRFYEEMGNSTKSSSNCVVTTQTIKLTEIQFNGGKIRFDYLPSEDSSPDRLDKIHIYQSLGNVLTEIKRFSLNHSYFLSSFASVENPPLSRMKGNLPEFRRSYTKRLKLESINEESLDKVTGLLTPNPPYKFDYFKISDSNEIPYLGSYAQDLWGHWNDAFNDDLLFAHPNPSDPASVPDKKYGSNRKQKFDYTISGTLKSIEYPTKGATEFLYEAPERTVVTSTVVPVFGSQNVRISTILYQSPGSGSAGLDETFVADYTGDYTFSFSAHYNCSASNDCIGNDARVEISNVRTLSLDLAPIYGISKSVTEKIKLVKGQTYRLRFTNPGTLSNYSQRVRYSLVASLSFSEQTGTTIVDNYTTVQVGGIRIKSITNKDEFGSIAGIKQYKYPSSYFISSVFDGNYESAGIKYNLTRNIYTSPPGPAYLFKFYPYSKTFTESLTVPLAANTSNSGVAYSKVEEIDLDKNEQPLGKTIYLFNEVRDYWKGLQSTVLINNSWRRTQLLEKKVYKTASEGDVLIKHVKNVYSDLYPELQDTIKFINATRTGTIGDRGDDGILLEAENSSQGLVPFEQVDQSLPGNDVYWRNEYSYAFNEVIVPRNALVKVENIDYDSNGLNAVSSIVNNYYDNPNHLFITRKEQLKSSGKQLVEKITYSNDYNLSSCATENLNYKLNQEIKALRLSLEISQELIYQQWIQQVSPYIVIQSPAAGGLTSNINIPLIVQLQNQYRTLQNDYNSAVSQKVSEHLSSLSAVENCKENQLNSSSPEIQALFKMQKNNQLIPIETASLLRVGGEEYLLHAKRMNYRLFNGAVKPFEDQQTELTSQLKYVDYMSNVGVYLRTYITYDDYDLFGNLIQYTPKNGVNNSFLWSYNGNFSVATIKNAGYGAIQSALGGAEVLSSFNKSNPNETQVNTFLAPLRTLLPHAQITLFTYKPLIGMSSQTDAKGMVTYYEYDNFQRLKHIKDQNGNIIKSYDYHYKP